MPRYKNCEYISEKKWDNMHNNLLGKGVNNDDARKWMNERFSIKE